MKELLIAAGVAVGVFALAQGAPESVSTRVQAAAPMPASQSTMQVAQAPRPSPREVAPCMIDARQLGLRGDEMREYVRECLSETG